MTEVTPDEGSPETGQHEASERLETSRKSANLQHPHQLHQPLSVVHSFVDALSLAGVKHICVSPGSRSTPLTISLATSQRFRMWSLLDERSAGFFAVGLARATGQVVALVCTSGTAVANYFPAVMEASHARLPLLILTADRPAELRGVGSNQTVDQTKIFGSHVKWSAELPVPEDTALLHQHAAASAWRAVAVAESAPMGPVHLNLPYREPLIPPVRVAERTKEESSLPIPMGKLFLGKAKLAPEELNELGALLQTAKRPLIVAGALANLEIGEAVLRLAAAWNSPVFADPLSNLRSIGGHQTSKSAVVVDTYDLFLPERHDWPLEHPDMIVRVGATVTSKSLNQYLAEHTDVVQVVVDEGVWRDPIFSAHFVVQTDLVQFANGLTQVFVGSKDQVSLLTQSSLYHMETKWEAYWRTTNDTVQSVIREASPNDDVLQEAWIVRTVAHWMPENSNLFVGNSMPIRELDGFFATKSEQVRVFANRGASGIDGVVSSAMGVHAATGAKTVLIIGDVSFYHDANGLLSAQRLGLNLTIVLIHNDGGGIFSFLPQANHPETFDHFQTAHGLDFAPLVKTYRGNFVTVHSTTELLQALDNTLEAAGLQVIQLRTSSAENVQWQRQLRQALVARLQKDRL